jgi:hypothetical protein
MSANNSPTSPADDESLDEELENADWPDGVAGWTRLDDESEFPEYWKAQSNHAAGGEYEQLKFFSQSNGEISLIRTVWDRFDHVKSKQTILSWGRDRIDVLQRNAREQMEQHPGNGEFDSKPSMPEAVGSWAKLPDDETGLNVERWMLGFGAAELTVEQTDMVCCYSHTKRPHKIEYVEPDKDTEIVVNGVPQTRAFEIAIEVMTSLSAPVSTLSAGKTDLQSVAGVGPAKSSKLLLLGITCIEELETCLADCPVNTHRQDAVEKLVTNRIADQLNVEVEQ